MAPAKAPSRYRIASVVLDEASVPRSTRTVERERAVAVYDLIAHNYFRPRGSPGGPYHLVLKLAEGRLVFDVRLLPDKEHGRFILALSLFRRIVRDYSQICESYYAAIHDASPAQIETIDMARRAVHDEGSRLLRERLKGKIDVDFDTARRLFTLVCALHGAPRDGISC